MNKSSKKVKTFKNISENFNEVKDKDILNTITIPVQHTTVTNQYKEIGDTVEHVKVCLEYTNYTKVYRTSTLRKEISKLKSCSRDLYLWLIYDIMPGKSIIKLNKERFMEEMDISLNTYKKAVAELLQKNIILETDTKDRFMINPTYFFCGDRISKFKEYTKTREEIKSNG